MKTYSKSDLEEKAGNAFKKYPRADAIHATSDGQFFFGLNRAELHAGVHGFNVYTFSNEGRPDVPEKKIKSKSKEAKNEF